MYVSVVARILLVTAVSLGSSGCTFLGMGVGALADTSLRHNLSPEQIGSVANRKCAIRIHLKDGTELRGRLKGLVRIPQMEYADQYAEASEKAVADGPLPAIGDRIVVTTRFNEVRTRKGEFAGLDPACVLLQATPEVEPDCLLFSKIRKISLEDHRDVDAQRLEALVSQGALPRAFRGVQLERDHGIIDVPFELIAQVQVSSSTGRVVGTILGVAGDVVLFIALQDLENCCY